jgi:hypothetical protein
MAQFGRPSTDTTNESWVDQADGASNIYTKLDEVSADDADYIKSALTPTSDVYVTKLSTVEDPVSAVNHTVRYRYAKSASGGDQIDLTVELRQGYTNEGAQGTLIATCGTHTNISDTWTAGTYTLSAGEANSITNYADLFLRFVANKP